MVTASPIDGFLVLLAAVVALKERAVKPVSWLAREETLENILL